MSALVLHNIFDSDPPKKHTITRFSLENDCFWVIQKCMEGGGAGNNELANSILSVGKQDGRSSRTSWVTSHWQWHGTPLGLRGSIPSVPLETWSSRSPLRVLWAAPGGAVDMPKKWWRGAAGETLRNQTASNEELARTLSKPHQSKTLETEAYCSSTTTKKSQHCFKWQSSWRVQNGFRNTDVIKHTKISTKQKMCRSPSVTGLPPSAHLHPHSMLSEVLPQMVRQWPKGGGVAAQVERSRHGNFKKSQKLVWWTESSN